MAAVHFDAEVARRGAGGGAATAAGAGRGRVGVLAAGVGVLVGAVAAGVRGRAVEEVELGVEGGAGKGGAVLVDFVDGAWSWAGAGPESGPRAGAVGGRRRRRVFGAPVQAVHVVELVGVFVDVGVVAVVTATEGGGLHEEAAAGAARWGAV